MADRSNPFTTKTSGTGDKGTRPKVEAASKVANEEIKADESKVDVNGEEVQAGLATGLIYAEMSAAELVPTGQYANCSIGPCRIHFMIDPNKEIPLGETYFSPEQRATIARALNEAAEIVEADVVAVQRNLVMESMQEQLKS